MALALDAGAPAFVPSREAEYREIEDWYRERLTDPFRFTGTFPLYEPKLPEPWPVDAVRLGPTWQWDADGWILPERTLGWRALSFAGYWLENKGQPWMYTMEQARFLLWFWSLDEQGQLDYHSAVLQRMKGHGKDPVGATVSTTVLVGDVEFDHFDHNGDPVGRQVTDAWVQIAAVSQDQTKNTMKLFPSLIPARTRQHFGIQLGKLNVWARGDQAQIEAVTASPMAIEGGRPKLIIRAETQNWNASNGGIDMAGAMEGNAAKAEAGAPARVLDICNAYREGEDSVGQAEREAWESTQGDNAEFGDYGLMYDSLEAPEDAPLARDVIPEVLEYVKGDSYWLQTAAGGRVTKSILNPRNSQDESRRKWYNQRRAAEDAWTVPAEIDPLVDTDAVLEPGEPVALFLDCAKTDDATVLVASRMTDGHVFTIGLWQRPPGRRGDEWIVPRNEVDMEVRRMVATQQVVGFFGDPGHAREDESDASFWDPLFSRWHQDFGRRLKIWARGTKGGRNAHAVMFDMAKKDVSGQFADAVAFTLQEIKDAAFTWDGDVRMRRHLLHARRYPINGVVSIAKEHRESRKKIDLAIGLVGARMVRRMVLESKKKGGGWAR